MPVLCTCPTCGLSFTRPPSESRRYCSSQCRPTTSDRFWAKVNKDGPIIRPELGPCWVWTAYRLPSGYGSFWVPALQSKTTAQRFSYQEANGVFPQDLDVCHHCDNPPCVRPSHLFLGTAADNGSDMGAKGRAGTTRHPEISQGERNGNALLTPSQVLTIRRRHQEGETCRSLGLEFGVGKAAISHIVTGRNWKHLPASDDAI